MFSQDRKSRLPKSIGFYRISNDTLQSFSMAASISEVGIPTKNNHGENESSVFLIPVDLCLDGVSN